ncbi:MAG TPA: transposase [Candidatus Paceibacterota bacterium]
MTRNISFSLGEFYHLYNRGTEKRKIFLNKADYNRFVTLLYICNSTIPVDLKLQGRTLEEVIKNQRGCLLVKLSGYCLMPNHFHLLIQENVENGCSLFMQKVSTAYTMYFNKKYERSGALFQGKFKARHADNDEYLKYLISYIHLNPIKLIQPEWKVEGITDRNAAENFLKKYSYSSFLDFVGYVRVEGKLLSREALPEYFLTSDDFLTEVISWLQYNPDSYKVEPCIS